MKHPNLKHCRPLRSGEKMRRGDVYADRCGNVFTVPREYYGDRYHRVTHPQVYRKNSK